jgi:5-deoxy-glucuronate isomerase
VDPPVAGWSFAGLRVADVDAGARVVFATAGDEVVIVPLAGSFAVTVDGDRRYELAGRASVWAGPSDVLYVPPGSSVMVASVGGGRVAVGSARAERGVPVCHVPAASVTTELRGAGSSSREVRNLAAAHTFAAERVIVVEVLTPAGNWSSYPPHKHDDAAAGEAELEEIYYYEVADGPGGAGLAYQQLYGTPQRPIELLAQVGSGDVVLIPHGWHGPAMAAPGYDLYYLNVMAGPGERAWRVSDDPAHAWVKGTWPDQRVDPRLPFGRRDASPR